MLTIPKPRSPRARRHTRAKCTTCPIQKRQRTQTPRVKPIQHVITTRQFNRPRRLRHYQQRTLRPLHRKSLLEASPCRSKYECNRKYRRVERHTARRSREGDRRQDRNLSHRRICRSRNRRHEQGRHRTCNVAAHPCRRSSSA